MAPRTRFLSGLPIALVLVLSGCGDSAPDGSMDAKDASLVAEGAAVYEAHCAECHGADRKGHPNWQIPMSDGRLHPPPQDETGHTWHHGDELLFKVVKDGGQSIAPKGFASGMPAFAKSLTDRQIWAALSYIKSTWPAEYQARQEARNPAPK